MGQKIRMRSDPSIAEPHVAGTKITLSQPALHVRYGVLMVPRPTYWALHLAQADQLAEQLRAVDAEILAVAVGESNARILDARLAARLYLVGTTLVRG